MNKHEIIERLKALNLDSNEYWVVAGSAMVMYGLRKETHDIDLGGTTKLVDKLIKPYPIEIMPDGTRRVEIADDIEMFENWLFDEIVYDNQVPVISITGLLKMKRTLNRQKDQEDIKSIEQYLGKKEL